MRQKLTATLNMLNALDSSRMTIVTYLPSTMELVMRQHGTVVVRMNHLIGYLNPIKHSCILLPEDLQELKATIKYIVDDAGTFLIAPIKSGYKVWEMGDTSYTSRPRFLTNLKFYSISNRFLLWLFKLKSEEARILFRKFDPKNKE